MTNIEHKLIQVATFHPDDKVAARAMRILHERYDKSYGWCWDCDGLVVKEDECCLNRIDYGKEAES